MDTHKWRRLVGEWAAAMTAKQSNRPGADHRERDARVMLLAALELEAKATR